MLRTFQMPPRILLTSTVHIIKQMFPVLKLQGMEWKQHAYIILALLAYVIA